MQMMSPLVAEMLEALAAGLLVLQEEGAPLGLIGELVKNENSADREAKPEPVTRHTTK